jgi:RNA polymerase sigma-70 factor (ECF subfamily)
MNNTPVTPLPYRDWLLGLAYRMVGDIGEAEDIVQEAHLRWFQLDTEHVREPKAFLRTMVTRLCLDHLRSARKQREEYIGEWLPTPWQDELHEDTPEQAVALAESLTLGFLHVLERLTPVERAVWLLREAFGADFDEVAEVVNKSPANCRQLFSRARRHLDAEKVRFIPRKRESEELCLQFMMASMQGELEPLKTLLAEDVHFWTDSGGKVRAARNLMTGPERVGRFLLGMTKKAADLQLAWGEFNHYPALLGYDHNKTLVTMMLLYIEEGKIRAFYAIRNPDKLAHLQEKTVT